ncbi:GNAT family N-acetyltransferase [Flavobacterium sp. AG291]|uniref:GNAT family N-acetyltransferase n=1 Tax=Flavobacterium sp. AG291 TaxID=2184000 RepID=UPI000E0A364A|nr:GNAT family protein [Flavobacterium sp. AG291]RDI14588.1 RimJ/RimL family protein N-acetyltransferase [Flavobacterium sp. AG291]
MSNTLNVREMEEKDIPLIIDYWFTATPEHLYNMGVDPSKLPEKEEFKSVLRTQLALEYPDKKGYALIWEFDRKPVGHCNVNPLFYGDYGYMHLHIWYPEVRQQGFGIELVKRSLPFFFDKLQLKKLFCEPYALNPAPNKLLEKVGFTFVKQHITTPGSITFEQSCNLWEITKP